MPKKNNLDWKTYEAITKYIYQALGKKSGVEVLSYGNDSKVLGKSGVNHQIDILTSHSDGIHSYKTAIECKYWKEKISKEIVMKVSEIIEDAGISKGVIVSKNGFTKDGFNFAKYKNIGLVELRELGEKDQDSKQKELEIGILEISYHVSILRPEILNMTIEYLEEHRSEKETININHTIIKMSSGSQKPFTDYIKAFQNELHTQKKLHQQVTKRYEILGGRLINAKNNSAVEITGLTFTGVLKQIDSKNNRTFSLVDEVWLIMKSIFEEKTFSISENGIIIENKK